MAYKFMYRNLFIVTIYCCIIAIWILITSLAEATEIKQIVVDSTEESLKKIDTFFEKNLFPDSAYYVVVDEKVVLRKEKDKSFLDIVVKLFPKEAYWKALRDMINEVSVKEDTNKKRFFQEWLQDKSSKGKSRITILGEEYDSSNKVGHSICAHLLGSENSNVYDFPLILEFELSDGDGKLLEKIDYEIGKASPSYIKLPCFSTDINIDSGLRDMLYVTIPPYYHNIQIASKGIKVALKLNTDSGQIKKIEASVINVRKAKEEAAAMVVRQQEEEQKRREEAQAYKEERRMEQQQILNQKNNLLQKYLSRCNGTILSLGDFITGKNPYADKGKCALIIAETLQMTSEKAGLFAVGNEVLYIEFPRTFRGSFVCGIANIKGVYTYEAILGTTTIPYLQMIQLLLDDQGFGCNQEYYELERQAENRQEAGSGEHTMKSGVHETSAEIKKSETAVEVDKVSTYYPLNVGNTWDYEGPFDKSGNPIGTERFEVTSYSDKYNAYLVESIVKTGDLAPITIQKIIEQRGNSVLQLAQAGGLFGSGLKTFEIPHIVLQAPLKIGKTWEWEDNAGKVRYKVVGFIKYKGKAGEFENVCKVEERTFLYDKTTHKLNEVDWAGAFQYYAPNVGLIKSEGIKTGTIVRELIRYSVK